MNRNETTRLVDAGLRAAETDMADEDDIWSYNSNDKVDIGERLASVIRTLHRALPQARKMRALSLGSSSEPQFRILETAFRGGLYLMDIERHALDIVEERIQRQYTDHVFTMQGSYLDFIETPGFPGRLRSTWMHGRKVDLITMHHSLYYCEESTWLPLFETLFRTVLAPRGAIHAVLMANTSRDTHTTTWLYNHFAGKFFGVRNNQSLPVLKRELERSRVFDDSQILISTSSVNFFVGDFEKFMKVVWMILLYPNVHPFTESQKVEIIRFVIDTFWAPKRPLVQTQHHLVCYRGLDFKGMI